MEGLSTYVNLKTICGGNKNQRNLCGNIRTDEPNAEYILEVESLIFVIVLMGKMLIWYITVPPISGTAWDFTEQPMVDYILA